MDTILNYKTAARFAGRRARWVALSMFVGLPVGLASLSGAGALRGTTERANLLGNEVPVGRGTARVYVVVDRGQPVEMGVALSEAALAGLPHPAPAANPEEMHFSYLLPLPAGNPTPFETVLLNWNPHGHEPEGVYTQPHFDFHFYTVTTDVIDKITPENREFETRGTRIPALEYVPAGYVVPAFVVVPRMGLHWIDQKAPEFNGEPFTTTFLYGSWDGRLIFAEPMVTKALIESKERFEAQVPMAEKYEVAGYHPSRYRIYWEESAREHRIALTGFVLKN